MKSINQSEHGLSGLVNTSNTCFINSFIQILSHSEMLNDFLDNNNGAYIQTCNPSHGLHFKLLEEWDNLRKAMWKDNCIVTPTRFLNAIYRTSDKTLKLFNPDGEQHDISELIMFLIEEFHNNVSREKNIVVQETNDKLNNLVQKEIKELFKKEFSEIWMLFYGIKISTTYKSDNPVNIHNIECCNIISLPIPDTIENTSIYKCMDLYTKIEQIPNVMSDINPKQSIICNKKMDFWNFPPILVICLQRAQINKHGVLQKNNTMVDFPLNIDLSKYVIGPTSQIYKYDLYGICNHIGCLGGGHYTSFVKTKNNNWHW